LEAVRGSANAALLDALDALGVGRTLAEVADVYPEALRRGGSAQSGRQIVLQHPAAQCTRCHRIAGSESTVGPTLDAIGSRLSRAELLEALLEPSATIAEGFAADGSDVSVSAMPPMGTLLQPRQIRDVVEFLATQR